MVNNASPIIKQAHQKPISLTSPSKTLNIENKNCLHGRTSEINTLVRKLKHSKLVKGLMKHKASDKLKHLFDSYLVSGEGNKVSSQNSRIL